MTQVGEETHAALAASVAAAAPRVVVLCAPPGYDKSGLIRSYGALCGTLIVCDLPAPGDAPDLARPVVEALVSGDRLRSARNAADRLAQRADGAAAASRETLRLEWPVVPGEPEVFVVRDVGGAFATPAGADLLGELVTALPPSRTLAIVVRAPLPPGLQHIVESQPFVTISAERLALSLDDVAELGARRGLSRESVRAVYDVARGWPLVTRMLLELAERDEPAQILEARALQFASLLGYAAHRTIGRLDVLVRDALVVAALLEDASQADLVRVLGEACDDLVIARLLRLPFVELAGDRLHVHAEVARLVRTRFPVPVKELYERALHVLSGDGAYARAARLALAQNDAQRAAAILDATPSYTAARLPLREYERILDRLDRDLVTRYPNVWLATIPFRAFSVDRATYVREAETIYFCLSANANSEQRAVVLMHLVSAYANLGRREAGETLLREALEGFAAEPSEARAILLRFSAMLRGIEGRFGLARELAREAARIGAAPEWDENQTLHYIDAHEAAFRARYERALVMFDELIRREARNELPLYLAYAATNAALVAWVNGDDESYRRYLGVMEDALTPGLRRGFLPMIEAARGRPVQLDEHYRWPVIAAIAHLYHVAEAPVHGDAVEAARAAVRAADTRADPFVQIYAHVALYVLDESARPAEAERLREVAAGTESPEFRDAVERLVRREPPGMLEPFVRARVLRERERREPQLVVRLLAGTVTKGDEVVRLSHKEFELLVLLASARAPVSRDRIGETLWDHLDPEEWPNNLKVTLSRLRSKLGVHDAVSSSDAGYRLSPTIDVDLRWAEPLVREHAHGALDDGTRDALHGIVAAYRAGTPGRYDRFAWMQPARARIDDIVCCAGLALARDALLRNCYDEAAANARAVTEIDPLNEEACEALMVALAALGESGAARREYRRYATELERELGAIPSGRLVELFRGSA
ncbi:MAG TPA: BTAD domain-containing putative transcriptional regulator [Candidatus Elarobacter sp.]|nr:BTAD domain-containing putative transcriptional regulator [Candidatus Elarobacter sp.]